MPRDLGARSKLLQVISLSILILLLIAFVFGLNRSSGVKPPVLWQEDSEIGESPDKPPYETEPKASAPVHTIKDGPPLPTIVGRTKTGLYKVKFPALDQVVVINPNANVLNRPHLVVPKDDYLGPRPHVDTEVDAVQIMNACRGSDKRLEYMKNTSRCIDYLAHQQNEYTFLPVSSKRASQQDPRQSEYLDADGHGNTKSNYIPLSEAQQATETLRGTCPGPIIPYHVYWRGPASWRVELFIKAYLYTQNLPCSQLHLWLDSDPFPNAVHDMLNSDPLFARFLPLVKRGDILVRAWHFPQRIPIPHLSEDDPSESAMKKLVANEALGKDTMISPNIVQDAYKQRWITLSSKQMTFLPVAVSDAVRFVVLHLHGGIYFDMDILMLRDMRPLVLPTNHSFAERWAMNMDGGYNTAVLSMTANSSLSTYFLRGAVSMGVNFHPLVLGIMAKKDGRNTELMTMEHGLFDALWTNYAGSYEGKPIVPDHAGDYSRAFDGKANSNKGEWQGYEGEQLPVLEINMTTVSSEDMKAIANVEHYRNNAMHNSLLKKEIVDANDSSTNTETSNNTTLPLPTHEAKLSHFRAFNQPIGYKDSFVLSPSEIRHLLNLSIVSNYDITVDKYPPTNRTLENFYHGAYTYHIHNQWSSHPGESASACSSTYSLTHFSEPNSWLNVMQAAHDGFFDGSGGRTNAYGEIWKGPRIMRYNLWPEFF